jgi:hypothetical protein
MKRVLPFPTSIPSPVSPTRLSLYNDIFTPGNFYLVGSHLGGDRLLSVVDNFKSNSELLLIGVTLLDIAITKNTICILTNDKIIYISEGLANDSEGLVAGVTINHIKGTNFLSSSIYDNLVVGWDSSFRSTDSISVASIFISVDGGKSFEEVNVSVFSNGSSNIGGYIMDISIQPSYNCIAILIRDANGTDKIVLMDPFNKSDIVNAYTSEPNETSQIYSDSTAAEPRVISITSGIFIWGDNLLFSPDGGYNLFQIVFDNPLLPNEYLKHLAVDKIGQFAALTSTNRFYIIDLRIFYGRVGLFEAIELNAGLSSASSKNDII